MEEYAKMCGKKHCDKIQETFLAFIKLQVAANQSARWSYFPKDCSEPRD